MRTNNLSSKDFLDLLVSKTGFTSKTITNIISSLINTIATELQTTGSVTVKDLGKFDLVDESGERYIINSFGTQEKVQVENDVNIVFTPNKDLIEMIKTLPLSVMDDKQIKSCRTKKRNKSDGHLDLREATDMAEASISDKNKMLDDLIFRYSKSQQRKYDGWLGRNKGEKYFEPSKGHGGRRIHCLTNDTHYSSIVEMADDLNITERRLRYAIKHGKDYIDGYRFEFE